MGEKNWEQILQEEVKLIERLFGLSYYYKRFVNVERALTQGAAKRSQLQKIELTLWGGNVATLLHVLIHVSVLRVLKEEFPNREIECFINEQLVEYLNLGADFQDIKVRIVCDEIDKELENVVNESVSFWQNYLDRNYNSYLYNTEVIYQYLKHKKKIVLLDNFELCKEKFSSDLPLKEGLPFAAELLADWAFNDEPASECIRKYLVELDRIFGIQFSTFLYFKEELSRTDPRNIDTNVILDEFCFLVKGIYERGGKMIDEFEVSSISVINQHHLATANKRGWILDVPDKNIIGRFLNCLIMSGWSKEAEDIPYLLWKMKHGKYFRSLQELLEAKKSEDQSNLNLLESVNEVMIKT